MLQSKSTPRHTLGWVLLLSAFLVAAPAWADHSNTDSSDAYPDSSYSFPRVVEGPATLLEVGGERESVEAHQPILVGDRLWVPHGSRLEVVLADRSLLRIEGEAEILFDRIAYSADTEDTTTAFTLLTGEVQLVVPEDVLGDSLPQISTAAGTINVHREGSFRIRAGGDWTELVVREGLAEVVTGRGSLLIHPGEAGLAEGRERPRLEVQTADRRNSLERWGDQLSAEAAYVPYVDSSLRYAAAPLAEHGVWVEVGHRRAWRPRVEVAWRPYYRGYWRHTALGPTWVSYDPWGWVTHHYGSWDHAPGYGWVWYPGRVYAPARVHWYYGPSYVGWCPSGYYGNYYARRHGGFGLHFGHYGFAAGWSHFGHWTFTASLHFGGHGYGRHGYGHRDHGYRGHGRHGRGYYDYRERHRSGGEMARERRDLEAGIITTNPGQGRGDPATVLTRLRRETDGRRADSGRSLPDVSDFLARKPLKPEVASALLSKPATKPGVAGRGGWATGEKPLPILAERSAATKPSPRPGVTKPANGPPNLGRPDAVKPAPKPSVRPGANGPPTLGRPDVARPAPKPSVRAEVTRPSNRPPNLGRPDVVKPAPKPSVRPEVIRPSNRPPNLGRPDVVKPAPKPSVRPEVTRPSNRPPNLGRPDVVKPVPRPSVRPEVTRPSNRPPNLGRPDVVKPAPRPSVRPPARRPPVTKPSVRPSTRPQASKPAVRPPSRPAPKPQVKSPPRSSGSKPKASSGSKPKASSGSKEKGSSGSKARGKSRKDG